MRSAKQRRGRKRFSTTKFTVHEPFQSAETGDKPERLGDLPLGARLLIRSRVDWRAAAIVRRSDEKVVLSVASPGGRTYRLSRGIETLLAADGDIRFIETHFADRWRENATSYDRRW